jgi:hypothetical protein
MAANPSQLGKSYSSNTESFFVRLVEDIGRALEPSPTQLATLERSYRSTSEFLVECPELKGFLEEIHPQGSRQMGTMTRPLRSKEGFDIDLVARMNRSAWNVYSGDGGATKLMNQLHSALRRYADEHSLKLLRWSRCATLEYADGMCADIAPIIDAPHSTAPYGEYHGMIPDRDLRSFHPTNPKGFSLAFSQIAAITPFFHGIALDSVVEATRKADITPLPDTEVFAPLLCRLIQMMKLHRDALFADEAVKDLRPSSILLTSLAASSYKLRAQVPHFDQLDLLLDIIRTMPTLITKEFTSYGQVQWIVDNPTAPGDNLASSTDSYEKQQAFTQWHRKLHDDVLAVIDTVERRAGLDQVADQVSRAFGDKAGTALRKAQMVRQSQQRSIGKVISITGAGVSVPMTSRGHTFFGS